MTRNISLLWLIGGILVLAGIAWIAYSLPHLGEHPEGTVGVSLTAQGFSGVDVPVSKDELEGAFTVARRSLDGYSAASTHWRWWAEVAAWVAFMLGGVITIFAGFLGLAVPNGGQDVQRMLATIQSRTKLSRLVGVLAATATVCTGASTKLKEVAEQERKQAVAIRELLINAQADLTKTKSEQDVRVILERLRTVGAG